MPVDAERLERLIEAGICPSKTSEGYAKELRELGQQLEKEISEKMLQLFTALSDFKRLKIIKLLLNRKMCVCELTEVFDVTQSTISHHLNILENTGLIKGFKKGKWTFYEIEKPEYIVKLLNFADEIV